MEAAGYKIKLNQKVSSVTFNENFAYFLGLIITDGHIVYNSISKKYKVAIYTSFPDERDMIITLIKDLFNYTAIFSSRLYGFNKKPNYEIRINSKQLANILINDFDIPSGAKSLSVGIPSAITRGNLRIKKSFLRGVIDGDGSIGRNTIKISSGSVNFLQGLKVLITELGIFSGTIVRDNRKTNTFSLRICCREKCSKRCKGDPVRLPQLDGILHPSYSFIVKLFGCLRHILCFSL